MIIPNENGSAVMSNKTKLINQNKSGNKHVVNIRNHTAKLPSQH